MSVIELGLEFHVMGGPGAFRLAGVDEPALQHAAAAALEELRRIERKYSRYDGASVVSRINAAAGHGRPIEVDEETAALLDFADRLHALSGGLFDITSGVLRRAWDFRVPRLPSESELQGLRGRIGWPRVRRQGRAVHLPEAGMELDFGGFAKEYAADRAAAVLLQHHVRHGYVNLAGDLRVFGPRPDGGAWPLGIRHPRDEAALIVSVELADGGLATSGDYERFIEVRGTRYCHVLDPTTGWPVRHWQSISVVGPTCAAAGAASTIAMLLQQRALEFLEAQGLPFVAVAGDGTVHQSL